MSLSITNKTILIFGGTGSLGYELNKRYKDHNIIYNFSRDECKHWEMRIHFHNHRNIHFIIGNVADKHAVKQAILRVRPNIIIIASAMKHIDQCEVNTGESIKTNLLGTQNIVDSIEEESSGLSPGGLDGLQTVVFVSSDKACSPINAYGLCKAMSESIMVEKAHFIDPIKFINVRYGNVLNSRGSIIPLLHKIGQDSEHSVFKLTDEDMTRFVMTLEDSVNLIEYAILQGESGETIIPKLVSMKVKDLIEIFAEKYKKEIVITGLRSGEKIMESLINESQSRRVVKKDSYMHIVSVVDFPDTIPGTRPMDYNSKLNPLSKEELKTYLQDLGLI